MDARQAINWITRSARVPDTRVGVVLNSHTRRGVVVQELLEAAQGEATYNAPRSRLVYRNGACVTLYTEADHLRGTEHHHVWIAGVPLMDLRVEAALLGLRLGPNPKVVFTE